MISSVSLLLIESFFVRNFISWKEFINDISLTIIKFERHGSSSCLVVDALNLMVCFFGCSKIVKYIGAKIVRFSLCSCCLILIVSLPIKDLDLDLPDIFLDRKDLRLRTKLVKCFS